MDSTEGVLTLIFGVITIGCFIGAAVAAADSRKLLGIFALVGAAATTICPFVLFIRASGAGFRSVQIGNTYIGWGLGFYLCILAGLASVVTGFIAMSASGGSSRRSFVPRTRRPMPARSRRPIARDRSRRRY